MKMRVIKAGFLLALLITLGAQILTDPVPTTLNDFFLPGSQPGDAGNLENPSKCDNCHGGYDNDVEPAFNWRGSMMAQAARDPLFFAAMAIANQDAPQSGDLCIRCHSPKGWLEGRSTPTDGSSLTTQDREGVQCDFCHKLVRPTDIGVNPYPDDTDYTSGTYAQDQTYLGTLTNPPDFTADGMYIADANNGKRGPFSDAEATHQFFYSPFHKESALCGTCHDVSNPAFSAVLDSNGNIVDYAPNAFDSPAPDFSPRRLFPVERTFSEWTQSAYNTPGGIPSDAFGGNLTNVSTCQDCHMKDTTGVACNKNGVPTRTDLGLHDLTGANTFIPKVIDEIFPGETDTAALSAGIDRARYMIQHAATMALDYDPETTEAIVYVENQTGHKLPSGYPEGRRIWINIRAWSAEGDFYESGHYDQDSAELVHDPDIKVYEIEPGISPGLSPIVGLPAGPSFHFVLNDTVYKDNRIPPRGFTNAGFEQIQSPPVGYSYADGQYGDTTVYPLPFPPAAFEVTLFYQTAHKGYIEFLRDANVTNDWGDILYAAWVAHGKSTPEPMQYASWGQSIVDNDHDGYPTFTDCDDGDPDVHPGATETVDCMDNNCDGKIDQDPDDDRMIFWTGCAGTAAWTTPGNWHSLTVPVDTQWVVVPVLIAGDSFPVITDSCTLKRLEIEQGATLSIHPGGTLNLQSESDSTALYITGTLENHGALIIQSSLATTVEIGLSASLINYGNCTIENVNQNGIHNQGMLVNETTGYMEIEHCDSLAITNSANADFINKGVLAVRRE